MDSLKGTLISVVIFALLIIPTLMDVMGLGIVNSQLNKVGAEMIQVIGSSSNKDANVTKAIEIADKNYKIKVELFDADVTGNPPISDYEFGDKVGVRLTKTITRFIDCQDTEVGEGCLADFETTERVLITKRE